MASDLAKLVAGTYIPSDNPMHYPPVFAWLCQECRTGKWSDKVEEFCRNQPESLDPKLVKVTSITESHVQACIPCKLFDHESSSPFSAEINFKLNPLTGEITRL